MIGTPEHEKIKARKRERHKVYLDNIRESPKCKIRTEKKEILKIAVIEMMVLWRELMHLKHRFKNVYITFV